MSHKDNNLAVVFNASDPAKNIEPERNWNILYALQSTLILEDILTLFSTKTQEIVPHDGFTYTNAHLEKTVKSGNKVHHSCIYKLTLQDMKLGEIKFMRRRRFGEFEVSQLETLLALLLFPLRNSILYLQALQSAQTDPLTKLYNREALNDHLQRALKVAHRKNSEFPVIFLDIDHFKSINDTFGHAIGDYVLKSVAGCLKKSLRAGDIVFRYGGEEFVILLDETTKSGVDYLSERLRSEIEKLRFRGEAKELKITASLGVASMQPGDSIHTLLKRADSALYLAKQNGRNRVESAFSK